MIEMPRSFPAEIRKPRCKRVDDELLKQLWPTRLPDRQLAAQMGHKPFVLRRRAKQLGLPPRRAIWATVLS